MKLYSLLILATIFSAAKAFSAQEVKPLKQVGFLGSGYDSHTEEFTNKCFKGSLVYGGDSSGAIQTSNNIDTDQLMTKLNIKAGAKFSLEVISAEGSSEFLVTYDDDDLRSSTNFLYEISGRSAVIENIELSTTGQRILAQAVQLGSTSKQEEYFYENCGDQVVDRVNLGGDLVVSVTFSASNNKILTNFKSKAKVDLVELISADSEAEIDLQKYSKDIKVQVVAKQRGGDPSKLGHIFTNINPNSKNSIIECSLTNLQPCRDAFKNIQNYVTNPDYGFGKQLNDLKYDIESSTGAAFMSYFTRNVNGLGLPELLAFKPKSLLGMEIEIARQNIIKEYIKHTRDRRRVNYLLDEDISISDKQRNKVITVKSIIESNRSKLRETFEHCQRNLNDCVNAEAKMKLADYDPRDLIKVFEFFDYCNLMDEDDTMAMYRGTVEAIKSALNLADPIKNNCEFIHTQIIPFVSSIDLSKKNIVDLSPLRGFDNLKTLDISDNFISNLEILREFKKLRNLKADHNRITDIDFVLDLNFLKRIDVSYNSIDTFEQLHQVPSLKLVRTYANDTDGDGEAGTPTDQSILLDEIGDLQVKNKILTVNQLCQIERDWLHSTRKISAFEHKNRSEMNVVPQYQFADQPDNSPIIGWFMCRYAYKLIPLRAEWDENLPPSQTSLRQ